MYATQACAYSCIDNDSTSAGNVYKNAINPSLEKISNNYFISMEINSASITINSQIKNIYGFLILSGWHFLIGTVSKNKKEINIEKEILNKPHWPIRRGSSANRFKRIYIERQYSFFKEIDELLEQFFIKDNKIIISGLIIAGSKDTIKAYLKIKNRILILNKYITTKIELENEGKLGFNEAIDKSMINDNL